MDRQTLVKYYTLIFIMQNLSATFYSILIKICVWNRGYLQTTKLFNIFIMQHVANKKKGKPYDDTKNLYSSSKENVVNYWS